MEWEVGVCSVTSSSACIRLRHPAVPPHHHAELRVLVVARTNANKGRTHALTALPVVACVRLPPRGSAHPDGDRLEVQALLCGQRYWAVCVLVCGAKESVVARCGCVPLAPPTRPEVLCATHSLVHIAWDHGEAREEEREEEREEREEEREDEGQGSEGSDEGAEEFRVVHWWKDKDGERRHATHIAHSPHFTLRPSPTHPHHCEGAPQLVQVFAGHRGVFETTGTSLSFAFLRTVVGLKWTACANPDFVLLGWDAVPGANTFCVEHAPSHDARGVWQLLALHVRSTTIAVPVSCEHVPNVPAHSVVRVRAGRDGVYETVGSSISLPSSLQRHVADEDGAGGSQEKARVSVCGLSSLGSEQGEGRGEARAGWGGNERPASEGEGQKGEDGEEEEEQDDEEEGLAEEVGEGQGEEGEGDAAPCKFSLVDLFSKLGEAKGGDDERARLEVVLTATAGGDARFALRTALAVLAHFDNAHCRAQAAVALFPCMAGEGDPKRDNQRGLLREGLRSEWEREWARHALHMTHNHDGHDGHDGHGHGHGKGNGGEGEAQGRVVELVVEAGSNTIGLRLSRERVPLVVLRCADSVSTHVPPGSTLASFNTRPATHFTLNQFAHALRSTVHTTRRVGFHLPAVPPLAPLRVRGALMVRVDEAVGEGWFGQRADEQARAGVAKAGSQWVQCFAVLHHAGLRVWGREVDAACCGFHRPEHEVCVHSVDSGAGPGGASCHFAVVGEENEDGDGDGVEVRWRLKCSSEAQCAAWVQALRDEIAKGGGGRHHHHPHHRQPQGRADPPLGPEPSEYRVTLTERSSVVFSPTLSVVMVRGEACGRVGVGDRVVAVGSVRCALLSHREVLQRIDASRPPITLTLDRSVGDWLFVDKGGGGRGEGGGGGDRWTRSVHSRHSKQLREERAPTPPHRSDPMNWLL